MARPPAPDDEKLESLLAEVEDAFDADRPERALALADEALLLAPRSVDALLFRAAALTYLERVEDAHQAYARALKVAPDDLDVLRGAAELLTEDLGDDREALEDAVGLCQRGLKLARKQKDDELEVEFLLLSARALGRLGEDRPALELLEQAARLAPDDPQVRLERGATLFQLLRLDEAQAELERAGELDPACGGPAYYLALIAERRGDAAAARALFAQARRLDPEGYPAPIELSAEEFDQAVKDALERLPPKVHAYLTNVTISVQEIPKDSDLRSAEPPLSPDQLMGQFAGFAYTERSTDSPWSHFPSAIVLYQSNLQRACRSREELLEQIGITLVHEVGHFLGLSEEELYDRGLD